MNFEHLIIHYGYAAILLGTFLEGETILIAAGFLAHRGYLHLSLVVAAAFAGTVMGDQLYFHLGRVKGKDFIARRPRLNAKSEKVFMLLEKHQFLLVLGFRFLYGIRTAAPFVLGASGLPPRRYLVLNLCGALIWAAAFGTAGYYFGYAIEAVIGEAKKYERIVVVSMFAAAVVLWLAHRLRRGTKGTDT